MQTMFRIYLKPLTIQGIAKSEKKYVYIFYVQCIKAKIKKKKSVNIEKNSVYFRQ